MQIHFIQHELYEAPGAFLNWALDRGHSVSFSRVYKQEPLPSTTDHIDLLIVMGGPQSPATRLDECSHFDAKAEIELIRKTIEANKRVIGVCLGAQLIGEALGAKYEHSPEKEIGVFPIRLNEDGLNDKNLAHLGSTTNVGHWHNDMPGLTANAKVLASSFGCPRQVIAYSSFVYGFQCHIEFTPELVSLLIAQESDLLNSNHTYPFVQKPNEIQQYDYREMNKKLYQFLDQFVTNA